MATGALASQVRGRLEQISSMASSDTISPSLSFETLLDTFLALYTDCKASSPQAGHINNFIQKYEKLITKLQGLRINTADFEIMKTLATGAVGKVCLVKHKTTKKLYAMKILKKMDLLTRQEAAYFMEERDALVYAKESSWITTLYAAFQDEENLYLVLEYASGGSLRALLNNREEPMGEEEARFYVAQILLALDELHRHNFIHRDVKPENCLIDASGYIKLADFGSCIRMGDTKLVTSHETVGTPDYISPEILRAHEGNSSYGRECDWWSLGIILYELLFDEVPFYSESLMETYGKIMDHEKHFEFPEDIPVSKEAQDIMRRLICKKEVRLGRDGSQDIQDHAWFRGFDWDSARKMKPPFIPELSGPDDTRYFNDEEDESKKLLKKPLAQTRAFTGQNLPFIGYTYLQDAVPGLQWRIGGATVGGSADWGLGGGTRGGARSMSGSAGEGAMESIRIQELITARQTAETEARQVAAQLNSVQLRFTELQTSLSTSEKKRSLLESTLSDLRALRESDAKERDALNSTLASLRRSLDAAASEQAEVEDVRSLNARLEKEVEAGRAQVKAAIGDLNAAREQSGEMERVNAALEAQLRGVMKQVEKEASANTAAATKQAELAAALETERSSKAELQLSLLQATQHNSHLALELASLQANLDSHAKEVCDLTTAKFALEKHYSAAQIEVEKLGRQNEALQRTLVEVRSRQHQAVSGQEEEMECLRVRMEAATDKIAGLETALASGAIELDETRKRVQTETVAHDATKDKLKNATTQLNDAHQTLMIVRQQLQMEVDAHRAHTTRAASQQAEMETKCTQLESTITDLTTQLEALKTDQNQSTSSSTTLPRAATINYEVLYFEAQTSIEELHTHITLLKSKLSASQSTHATLTATTDTLKSQLVTSMRESDDLRVRYKDIAVDLDALKQQFSSEKRTTANLGVELTDARIALRAAQDTAMLQAAQMEEWRLANQEAMLRNEELEVQCTLAETQARNLKERIHELEQTCTALHSQIDGSEDVSSSRRADSLLSSDSHPHNTSHKSAKSPEKTSSSASPRSKGGWKQMLFRTNSQPFKVDTSSLSHARGPSGTPASPADNLSSSQELGYMDSTSSHSQLERRRSTKSSFSMKSSMTKSSDALRVDVDVLNMRQGLSGWLKVPKGGKVKKGWKLRYAVVRDLRVYMYDRDKDVGTMDGNLIADLRCDIFIAKIVAQNELIHANGKDIDCIFKIQSASLIGHSHDSNNNTSHTSLASAKDIGQDPTLALRRITKLSGEIALEEKMLQAAEKMWMASSGVHRATLETQIGSSKMRLAGMKNELIRLRDEGENAGASSDATDTADLTDIDYEEVTMLRRRLAGQLIEEERKRAAVVKVGAAAAETTGAGASGPVGSASPARGAQHGHSLSHTVENELVIADRAIERIRTDIENLSSKDPTILIPTIRKIRDTLEGHSSNGHAFKLRQYYKPIDCAVCHEPLWGGANQGLECTVCKMICHKSCKGTIDLTCAETQALATAQPLYFLAQDPQDRQRWLSGLDYFRKEAQREMHNPNPRSPHVLFPSKSITAIDSGSHGGLPTTTGGSLMGMPPKSPLPFLGDSAGAHSGASARPSVDQRSVGSSSVGSLTGRR
ncbi:hypothetical protein DFJ77DRAFT_512718 [Powellomyces hirtus]|nr:hypothetical protein DFJ77DRAFT_512718 [Powellomyces hirtus]